MIRLDLLERINLLYQDQPFGLLFEVYRIQSLRMVRHPCFPVERGHANQ